MQKNNFSALIQSKNKKHKNKMITKPKNVTQQLSSKVQLPRNHYIIRIINEEFGPSKNSGNKMFTLEAEIVSPDTVEDSVGNTIECAASKFKMYFPIENDKPQVQDNMITNLFDLYTKIGQSVENIDEENPKLFFKEAIEAGKPIQLDVILYGKEQKQVDNKGKPILIGGKPVISYQIQVDSIHGLNTDEVNKPY